MTFKNKQNKKTNNKNSKSKDSDLEEWLIR